MNSFPHQRLNVFISSAMREENGTNWLEIRKKVKNKLASCPYINPFIIEDHASEIPSISYFKFMVSQSDIVILLVKEELRFGVQTEFSVVYEENKPCLAYFYDGKECDLQTIALKNNIMDTDFTTFRTISNFENIEEYIYDDLIQNVITQYKFNYFNKIRNLEDKNISVESSFKDTVDNCIIEKDSLDIFSSCVGTVLNNDGYSYLTQERNNGKSFNHDFGCQLLNWIAKGEDFPSSSDIIDFLNSTNYIHSDKLWYRYRWDSISYYKNGNIKKALEYQVKALDNAKQEKVDQWLINNILIDCRNLEFELRTIVGEYTGTYQEELSKQDTFVQFPILDRMKANVSDNIEKERFKISTSNIYTTHWGSSIGRTMENIENYIFISSLYGSQTHLYMSREIIANTYMEYAQIHDEEKMYYLAFKYWMLANNYNKLEKFLTQYWDKLYLQLCNRCDEIWNIIKQDNIKVEVKCIIFKFLGLYFNDNTYELIQNYMIKLENIITHNNSELYIDSLIANSERLSQEVLVDIINNLLEKNKLFMGSKISRLIFQLILNNVKVQKIEKLEYELCKKLKFIIEHNGSIQIVAHLYKQKPELFNKLNKLAEEYLDDIEKEFYYINTTDNNDWTEVIDKLISVAESQYNQNNVKGTSYGFSIRPLETLAKIIQNNFDIKYEQLILKRLIPLCKDILDSYVPLAMKEESIKCLIKILNKFEEADVRYDWNQQFNFLSDFSIDKEQSFSIGYVSILAVDLRTILFKTLIGFNTADEIFYKYLSFNNMGIYEKRVLSDCISTYIEIQKSRKQSIDNAFIMIIYALSDDGDEIVRRNVVRTLGELSSANLELQIKQKMNELMLDSNLDVKFEFINIIKKNKIRDSIYVVEILNNYCEDKNYLLREAAKRLKLELRNIS